MWQWILRPGFPWLVVITLAAAYTAIAQEYSRRAIERARIRDIEMERLIERIDAVLQVWALGWPDLDVRAILISTLLKHGVWIKDPTSLKCPRCGQYSTIEVLDQWGNAQCKNCKRAGPLPDFQPKIGS